MLLYLIRVKETKNMPVLGHSYLLLGERAATFNLINGHPYQC